jgi:O-acetyl-ADP-ribose deacetylase (regulator of RNase III)
MADLMSNTRHFGNTLVSLVRDDITRQDVDAIVNAANSGLRGGGGVDGAIHRAAGPSVLDECRQILSMQGQCAPGAAVITGGGSLRARYIIHAVGPIWRDGRTNEERTLASAYRTSLELAVQYEVKTIAFPSISTGAYGYPLQEAAQTALGTVKSFCEAESSFIEVRFVLFDQFSMDAYIGVLEKF